MATFGQFNIYNLYIISFHFIPFHFTSHHFTIIIMIIIMIMVKAKSGVSMLCFSMGQTKNSKERLKKTNAKKQTTVIFLSARTQRCWDCFRSATHRNRWLDSIRCRCPRSPRRRHRVAPLPAPGHWDPPVGCRRERPRPEKTSEFSTKKNNALIS